MSEIIKVGMADLNICKSPDGITTLGLGSCVGIAVRDPQTGVGGLAHIMLPDSTQIQNNSNIPKFADTGIEDLVKKVVAAGASRSRLVAKIAGGAQMFSLGGNADSLLKIGARNVEACRNVLSALRIPILSEDTGGSWGRTVELFSDSGMLEVRAIGREKKFI